jgi:hypothetical protein
MAKVRINWPAVQRSHDAGSDRRACCSEFGFTMGAWYKAIRKRRLTPQPCIVTRYDWSVVQAHYDEGHTYRECRMRFGFSAASWGKAINTGKLIARTREWPLQLLLERSKSRFSIKRRLLKAGILKNACDECGLSDWRGRPLSIQIDHRNGISDDYRLENLRMLCPNCHSQTENFAGRNAKRKRSHLV